MPRLSTGLKAIRELGPKKLGLFACYQVGLRTGYFRRATTGDRRGEELTESVFSFRPVFGLPGKDVLLDVLDEVGMEGLLVEANEIVDGRVRLFGGEPVPLCLTISGSLEHWTAYVGMSEGEAGHESEDEGFRNCASVHQDVKFIWEPGRFGWAYTLGRAYYLSGDERFAAAYWKHTETFLEGNPPYMGLHWASGQEVALRLIAFVIALQVFSRSEHTTPGRVERLAKSITDHARRIPPTLIYARAQNNNHLITEAAGLYTAGLAVPAHPSAERWRSLGWRWFQRGLGSQIAQDGAYMQQSANYHRLMLQVALWMQRLADSHGQSLPDESLKRLAAATRWLLTINDPASGRVPNLGPNDGAYILPFTVNPFSDYRPVLQAAGEAFLGELPFDKGTWDELRLWFVSVGKRKENSDTGEESLPKSLSWLSVESTPHVIRSARHDSWAYLRAARFNDRPGHADQLHLDLWWRGLNIAQDAGTYCYNAPAPWDNALTGSGIHNTVSVNDRDQMTRVGRFLYLDWAQAQVVTHELGEGGAWERIVAQHDGYRHIGVIHQRAVTAHADGRWVVKDALLPASPSILLENLKVKARLHWLLPDWAFEWGIKDLEFEICLESPFGMVKLVVSVDQGGAMTERLPVMQAARAGELAAGAGKVSPTWGWSSPSYGDKIPALSLGFTTEGDALLAFKSEWKLPPSEA